MQMWPSCCASCLTQVACMHTLLVSSRSLTFRWAFRIANNKSNTRGKELEFNTKGVCFCLDAKCCLWPTAVESFSMNPERVAIIAPAPDLRNLWPSQDSLQLVIQCLIRRLKETDKRWQNGTTKKKKRARILIRKLIIFMGKISKVQETIFYDFCYRIKGKCKNELRNE